MLDGISTLAAISSKASAGIYKARPKSSSFSRTSYALGTIIQLKTFELTNNNFFTDRSCNNNE